MSVKLEILSVEESSLFSERERERKRGKKIDRWMDGRKEGEKVLLEDRILLVCQDIYFYFKLRAHSLLMVLQIYSEVTIRNM